MPTPKEWRGVKILCWLKRRAGGKARLVDFGRTKATVRFRNGDIKEMTREELYERYTPI